MFVAEPICQPLLQKGRETRRESNRAFVQARKHD
jgi:hypothetical protein